MSPIQSQAAREPDPGTRPSRVGETLAEVSFALLLLGVWLVTCVAV